MQFAGDISGPNGFKTHAKRSPAPTFDNARERLHEVAESFRQVIIEDQDYRQILSQYDETDGDVVFYCDLPYLGGEHYYDCDFDHAAFVETLREIDSRWLMSYTELPDGFEDHAYHILDHERRHRMCRGSTSVTEHLVCNFDPATTPQFIDHDYTQQTLTDVSE